MSDHIEHACTKCGSYLHHADVCAGNEGTPDESKSKNQVQEHEEESGHCEMCGGDGSVMLSECGPGEWGEDCFCDVDRLVVCPRCRGQG